jgi:hypothetical protein
LTELLEDGLALENELAFAGSEELGELRAVHERLDGEGEAIEFGGMAPGVFEGGDLDIDFHVKDAGFGGDDAGEAPIDGGEETYEAEFSLIDRLEATYEGVEKGLEGFLVLAAEDASELGVAAVLEGVHGGTGFTFGRLGAARPGAVPAGCNGLLFRECNQGHYEGPHGIIGYKLIDQGEAKVLCH